MDLILRSQAGDIRAFETLFHNYKNLVYKTAYLMLNDADEAEDALQEVFIQVYKSLPTYQATKGALTTWLYRITVNHCLNRRRRQHLAISLDRFSAAPPSEPSHENQMTEEAAMQHALGRLSDKLRTVVILRYYWGLSYAEIVQILDIPLGTVKSRLNQALGTLRKELEDSQKTTPSLAISLPYEERS